MLKHERYSAVCYLCKNGAKFSQSIQNNLETNFLILFIKQYNKFSVAPNLKGFIFFKDDTDIKMYKIYLYYINNDTKIFS